MIRIEKYEVMGWEHAIRGMRNPMNSWDKSDTTWFILDDLDKPTIEVDYDMQLGKVIGDNDLDLMKRLVKAGTDHRKFMRMITVYVDIIAPLYWWKEFDTYKVGTVANSCSTMHKIHDKEFTLRDFSHEHLDDDWDKEESELVLYKDEYTNTPQDILEFIIDALNFYRKKFLETKDKKYWWQMIQLLPSSYNQKRTIMLNYEVLSNMYHSRKKHKLDEWKDFCNWIHSLPYSELITHEN